MVEAVRTAVDIPLRAAIAAAEGHDPSLSRSGSPDRAGAAFFWLKGSSSLRRASSKLGMENWSLLKRGLHGTYISVEPFHLFRYIDEQVFRFNTRKITDAEDSSQL